MNELEDKIEKIVLSCGLNLYGIETLQENYTKIFRVLITKKDGINHNDCQKVSEIISPLLDIYNPINGKYNLEVSSPGIERKLKNPRHFELSYGEKIQVTLNDKTVIIGLLGKSDNNGFYVDDKFIQYSDTRKVKSIFEW